MNFSKSNSLTGNGGQPVFLSLTGLNCWSVAVGVIPPLAVW